MINIYRKDHKTIINRNNNTTFTFDDTLESGYYNIDYRALYNRTNVSRHVFNFDHAGVAYYNVI